MAAVHDEAAAAIETSVAPSAARPDWRRQRHTWFLVGLSAANVAIDWLAGRSVDVTSSSTEGLVVGVLLGGNCS